MRNTVIPKHALLDYLIEAFKLKNNRALAQHLGVTQSAISKIRYRNNPPSAEFILLIYDRTDMTIEEIRALIKKQEKLDGSNA